MSLAEEFHKMRLAKLNYERCKECKLRQSLYEEFLGAYAGKVYKYKNNEELTSFCRESEYYKPLDLHKCSVIAERYSNTCNKCKRDFKTKSKA